MTRILLVTRGARRRGEPTTRRVRRSRAKSSICAYSGRKRRGFDRSARGTHRAGRRCMERSVLVEQAAELLGVSRRTVYYRIRDGRLRTIRTRCGSQRVLLSTIERLLREEQERREKRKQRAARRREAQGRDERATARDAVA